MRYSSNRHFSEYCHSWLFPSVPTIPHALWRVTGTTAAIDTIRILSLLVVSICAKRFHMHYGGKPALLNRHYSRNQHYSDRCHYWLFPSVPSDFTGTITSNRHCSGNRHYTGSTTVPGRSCRSRRRTLGACRGPRPRCTARSKPRSPQPRFPVKRENTKRKQQRRHERESKTGIKKRNQNV